jgi:hypothetical protein
MSVYPSKRDLWLMLIVSLLPAVMIFSLVAVITDSGEAAFWVRALAVLFFAVFTAFSIWMTILPYRTFYELRSDSLEIRVGPFKYVISLSEITEAYPTHNPLSSPAWSLDRVRIRYSSSKFGALISPDDKVKFLAELESLAPQLEREGDRLRKPA